jgi:hypothetical protein
MYARTYVRLNPVFYGAATPDKRRLGALNDLENTLRQYLPSSRRASSRGVVVDPLQRENDTGHTIQHHVDDEKAKPDHG